VSFQDSPFNAGAADATLLLSICCFSAGAQMIISGTPPATATVAIYSLSRGRECKPKGAAVQLRDLPSWSVAIRGSGRDHWHRRRRRLFEYPNQGWDGVHFADGAVHQHGAWHRHERTRRGLGHASLAGRSQPRCDGTPLKISRLHRALRYEPLSPHGAGSVSSPNSTSWRSSTCRGQLVLRGRRGQQRNTGRVLSRPALRSVTLHCSAL